MDAVNARLLDRYLQVRAHTEHLASPLSPEDMVVQSMPDASPVKWHLAHTSWFFETFLLSPQVPGYQLFDPQHAFLFNSYYEALGPRQHKTHRGLMTRPALPEVMAYRQHVDAHMRDWLASSQAAALQHLVWLGLAHEEQHQELLLMDVLDLFSRSPLKPAYNAEHGLVPAPGREGRFIRCEGAMVDIGHAGDGFAFDNESPRHSTWLGEFEISDRLVTNRQWLAFMADGGYVRPEFWLADGWAVVQAQGWRSPEYWMSCEGGEWHHLNLRGLHPLDLEAPVMHISYYEAAAYACWVEARLPTEAEWECAARAGALEQVDDAAWQWTQSAYSAYPGYRAPRDAIGEYNGKFMVNQMVLRGGAHATPPGHARISYRNFYRPEQRWMFSSLRLARDVAVKSGA